jgi:L,D-transpeptidase YcfS
VQIINEPVKFATEPDGKRYVEVHQPLSHTEKDDPQTMKIALSAGLKKFAHSNESDTALFKQALARRSGMPVLINDGEAIDEHTPLPAILAAQTAAQPESTEAGK